VRSAGPARDKNLEGRHRRRGSNPPPPVWPRLGRLASCRGGGRRRISNDDTNVYGNEKQKRHLQNLGKISLTAPRLIFWRVRVYGKRGIFLGLGGMGAHSTLGNIISTCDLSSKRIAPIKGFEQPLADGAAILLASWWWLLELRAQKKHFHPSRIRRGQTVSAQHKRQHFDKGRRTPHSISRSLEHGSKFNRAGCDLCSQFSVGGDWICNAFTQSIERGVARGVSYAFKLIFFLFFLTWK